MISRSFANISTVRSLRRQHAVQQRKTADGAVGCTLGDAHARVNLNIALVLHHTAKHVAVQVRLGNCAGGHV